MATSFGPALLILVTQQVVFPMSAGLVLRGLVLGGLTAMIALGMSMVYRANRIINFAQADLGLAPAVVAFLLVQESGLPYPVALLAGLAVAVVFGGLVERLVIRRFFRAPRLLVTIATIGLSQVLVGLALLLPRLWGLDLAVGRLDPPFDATFDVGSIVFNANDLMVLVVAPVTVAVVALFLQRSDVGVAIRASADSADRASLLGVPVHRLQTIVWSVAAALAFLTVFLRSGVQGIPTLSSALGLQVLLRALVALMLGRMTHLTAVTSAAIALGVFEQGVFANHGEGLVIPALAVVVAVTLVLRRAEIGRGDSTEDAAWRAAEEVRPVPWRLYRLPEVRLGRAVAFGLLAVVAIGIPYALDVDQVFNASTLLIYALLGLALVLLSGWGGIVSLGHIAYFALGAAFGGWLMGQQDMDLLVTLLCAAALGAVVSTLVGVPTLRLRGMYLAVSSFAFALAASTYLLDRDRFDWVPGSGVLIRRPPVMGGLEIESETGAYHLILFVLFVAILGARNIRASRFGRALVALRDNERAAQAYAVSPPRVRLAAFALSGAIAALAGALFTFQQRTYDASAFGPLDNLAVFTMVVVGGMTSATGAVLGALYFWGTRWFLDDTWSIIAQGAGVILVLLVFPKGLAGVVFSVRDRWLRTVARARRLDIPGYTRTTRTSSATTTDTSPSAPDAATPATGLPGAGDPASASGSALHSGPGSGPGVPVPGSTGAGVGSASTPGSALHGAPGSASEASVPGSASGGPASGAPGAGAGSSSGHPTTGAGDRDVGDPAAPDVDPGHRTGDPARGTGPSPSVEAAGRVTLGLDDEPYLVHLPAPTGDPVLADDRRPPAGTPSAPTTGPPPVPAAGTPSDSTTGPPPVPAAGAPSDSTTGLPSVPAAGAPSDSTTGLPSVPAADTSPAPTVGTPSPDSTGGTPSDSAIGTPAALADGPPPAPAPGGAYREEPMVHGFAPAVPAPVAEGELVLDARGVEVAYGGVPILFGVDLAVRRGEAVALLGTNGAGKSTLLKAISGLVAPKGGTIRFGPDDITGRPAHKVAALGLLQMPGGHGVFPTLSVADNLRVASWLHRRDKAAVNAGVERVERLFPVLAQRRDERASNLSGGQQQMLALGMALLGRPRLLMIDELSLGLAPSVVGQLMEFVGHLREEGTTLVVVEQSVNVALNIADRAVFLERGEVRFSGPAGDLLDRPDLLRSVFLSSASAVSAEAAELAATAAAASTPAHPAPANGAPTNGTPTRPAAPPATATDGGGHARPEPLVPPAPVIETRNLTVAFGGVRAVDDVTFEVAPGEIVGVIGPNGAGKTTLFDLLSGFVPPTGGRVLLDGRDVTHLRAAARAKRGLGRSFQDARLFSSLTVDQAIAVAVERWVHVGDPLSAAFGLPNAFDSEHAVRRRVSELVDLLGLQPYRSLFIGELSTGTRRVVDLACLLAHRPGVVLLDEPASGIAQREVEALAPLIRRIRDEMGASVVLVEHDIPLVEEVADRMVAMDRGRVLAVGTPAEVLSDPAVVSSYLGDNDAAVNRSDRSSRTTSPRPAAGNEREAIRATEQ